MQVLMDDLVVQGENAEYRWTLVGTNTGPGGTGRRVRISGFDEWTIGDDGLIARSLGHYDQDEYDRQLRARGTRTALKALVSAARDQRARAERGCHLVPVRASHAPRTRFPNPFGARANRPLPGTVPSVPVCRQARGSTNEDAAHGPVLRSGKCPGAALAVYAAARPFPGES